MESTLSIDRNDLLNALGRFLGWHADVSRWTEMQSRDADTIIAKALRQAYGPPCLPGEKRAHSWSFLRPVATIFTTPNQGDYTLPDDFGGAHGPITYTGTDPGNTLIEKVSVQNILICRQAHQNTTGFPSRYAIAPLATEGQSPQRFTLMLEPIPSGVWELKLRYRSNPYNLSAGVPYPLGGQAFADCLTTSVVAAADEMLNDVYMGPTYMRFMESLRTAVAHDRQEHLSGNLGYNSDPGMEPMVFSGSRDTAFTINGSSFSPDGFYFDE